MALAFDKVIVAEGDGTSRSMEAKELLALKLNVRVRYILEKRLRFFSGSREVDQREALRSLQ